MFLLWNDDESINTMYHNIGHGEVNLNRMDAGFYRELI